MLPSRPTTVSATNRALITASSVASTVAVKTSLIESSTSSWTRADALGEAWRRGSSSSTAQKMSPEPWPATLPTRASPSPTRRATRVSWRASSGMSVATTPMQLPASLATGGQLRFVVERRADRAAGDAQLAAAAEVGEHQHADRAEAVEHARRRADAGLEAPS